MCSTARGSISGEWSWHFRQRSHRPWRPEAVHVSRCNQTGGAHIHLEAHRKHHQHFSKAVDDKIVVYKDPDISIGYDENMVLEEVENVGSVEICFKEKDLFGF